MNHIVIGEWIMVRHYVPWRDHLNMKNSKKLLIQAGRIAFISNEGITVSIKGKNIDVLLSEILSGPLSDEKEYVSRVGEIFFHRPEESSSKYIIGRIIEEIYIDNKLWYTGTIEHRPFHEKMTDIKRSYITKGRYVTTFPSDKVTFGTPTFGAPFLDLFVFRLRNNFLGPLFHFQRIKIAYVQLRSDLSWSAFTSKENGIYLGPPCERFVRKNLQSGKLELVKSNEIGEPPSPGHVVYFKSETIGNKTSHHWFRPSSALDSFIRWVQTDGKDERFYAKSQRDLLNLFGKEGSIWRSMMEGFFLGRLNEVNSQLFSETGLWQFLSLNPVE